MPALYETVTLKSSKNCRVTLNMLLHRKDICGYIRKLAVRPNYYLAWPKPDEHLSEAWVVETIEHLSTSLTAMHTFVFQVTLISTIEAARRRCQIVLLKRSRGSESRRGSKPGLILPVILRRSHFVHGARELF